MHPSFGRRAAVIGAVVLATALLAACGGDADDSPTPTATDTAAAGEAVLVTAVDYAFEGLPGTLEAGTKLELTNESTAEVHELVAIRLPDDETRSAEELLALPEEELEGMFTGPPAAVLVAPPAQPGFAAAGDGTLTEPGRYLFACFIPTGADPAAFMAAAQESPDGPPDVDGGPPHFTEGMYAEATVS